jgi:hypothetical protein
VEMKLEVVVMPASNDLTTFFAALVHTTLAFGIEYRVQRVAMTRRQRNELVGGAQILYW